MTIQEILAKYPEAAAIVGLAELVDADNRGNRRILFTKQVNGNIYSVRVERGNNQIGVITLWKNARSGASC